MNKIKNILLVAVLLAARPVLAGDISASWTGGLAPGQVAQAAVAPVSAPVPGAQQTFVSEPYLAFEDAAAARVVCLEAVTAAGYIVNSSFIDRGADGRCRFTVVFSGAATGLSRYQGWPYQFRSDAEAAMDRTAESLRRTGAVVLEAAVTQEQGKLPAFSVSYIRKPAADAHAELPVIGYQGVSHTWSSQAAADLQACIASLRAVGVEVLEYDIVSGWSFVVRFAGFGQTHKLVSGRYAAKSEAEAALAAKKLSLGEAKNAVIEGQVTKDDGSYTYMVVYFTPEPGKSGEVKIKACRLTDMQKDTCVYKCGDGSVIERPMQQPDPFNENLPYIPCPQLIFPFGKA